jgi:hypothetical protein
MEAAGSSETQLTAYMTAPRRIQSKFSSPRRGSQPFSEQGATFTLSYRLAGRKVINEDNLLKRHGNLLKMLANYAYYCDNKIRH